MATNPASQFNTGGPYSAGGGGVIGGDILAYLDKKVLPISYRHLVVYAFGEKITLPKNRGVTFAATRYERINLPYTTLAEGVPPLGQAMTISQVFVNCQQWGDKVVLTDVAHMTIYHDVFQQGVRMVGYVIAETYERNTFNALLAGTQVMFVNNRANRASLVAGDVLDPHTCNRLVSNFHANGVYAFNSGQSVDQPDRQEDISDLAEYKRRGKPEAAPHFCATLHPFVEQDMRENSLVAQAWAYSDVNALYNNEIGAWGGIRFTRSNLVPFWVGVTAISPTVSQSGGSLTGGGGGTNYYVQVTAAPALTSVEKQIYGISGAQAVTANVTTGSIAVTLPTLAGYVFNVYISTSATMANASYATVAAGGPIAGPLQGQGVQLAGNQTVTITGIGTAAQPPAPPANGVTVFPTFVFGQDSFAIVELDKVEMSYLKTADKSDPLNQLRVIGWKIFYGTLIKNNQFFARIESSSAFSAAFNPSPIF